MRFQKSIIILFIGVALLSSIKIIYNISLKANNIEVSEIENNLHSQEIKLSKVLAQYTDTTKSISASKLQNENITILKFEGKSLVFWSDNSINFNINNPNIFDKKGAFKVGSRIFISQTIENGKNKTIGLLLIKKAYPFENKYLKNDFNEKLEIPDNYNISFKHTKLDIKTKSGDFAFSLIKEKEYSSEILDYFLNLLFFVSVILIIVSIRLFIKESLKNTSNFKFQLISIITNVSLWYIIVTLRLPEIIFNSSIFSSFNFAQSEFLPSLGDFILITIFIISGSYNYFKYYKTPKNAESTYPSNFIIITTPILILFYTVFLSLFNSLIFNSNINIKLFDLKNLDLYSLLFYLSISLLLLAFILFADKTIRIISKLTSVKNAVIIIAIIFPLQLIFYYFIFFEYNLISIIYLFALTTTLLYVHYYAKKYSNWTIILLVILSSAFTGIFATSKSAEKEKEQRKLFAVGVSSDRDYVAESQFADFEYKLINDSKLGKLVKSPTDNTEKIYKHIKKNYFHSYWSKYTPNITICGSARYFNPENEISYCNAYFDRLISDYGRDVPGSDFKYLDIQDGRIHYFKSFNYKLPDDSSEVSIYIELISKLRTEKLGFPKLLIAGNDNDLTLKKEYSYAKYKNNKLIFEHGDYFYNLSPNLINNNNKEFSFIDKDGYNHLIYKNKDNTTIVSVKNISLINYMSTYSYLFVFYIIIITISLLIVNKQFIIRFFELNLKNTIQLSMLGILVFSFISIGIATAYLQINQSKKANFKDISEKTQSILVELQHKFSFLDEISPNDYDYISNLLEKWSYVFFTDVNMYNTDGKLIASSRPEIFDKRIIGEYINAEAYIKLKEEQQSEYIHEEHIGNLDYSASYIPFLNDKNNIIAYINLSYFSKKDTISEKISDLIITLLNIYALLFVLTAFAGILLSHSITKPLYEIKKKFGQISLLKTNSPVFYNRNDEIGELVNEYNRVIGELEQNAQLLAKSERESAWREMAKQIAHEIKNPLTPMKLSIQFLVRSWKNKDDDFDEKLSKVSNTMMEQIDALSAIATEFSDFANMPKSNKEKINLYSQLTNVIDLFNANPNITFIFNKNCRTDLVSIIDREQIIRVFNNLIKNAIQAIPENKQGIIKINITQKNNIAVIEITDNGKGIPDEIADKLFKPNFTTKTGGTGLGLAICKNIIEMNNGDIYFRTNEEGSTFIVELVIV